MSTTFNNLPPDIIEAILRWLPEKSLGRCKCVSKPWLSLISNPQFIKTHLLNNHHHTKLILISDLYSLYSLDITPADIFDTRKHLSFRQSFIMWKEILGSCNGVVLARDEDDKIYLINPTTRELLKIPVSPFAPIGKTRKGYNKYGFGYDSSTDDYKVISILNWGENTTDDVCVSIYSLRYNSWRKLQNLPYCCACRPDPGVLINDKLHWLVCPNTRIGINSFRIIVFSLANEEFEEIELPDSINGRRLYFKKLGVVGGKLVLYGSQLGNGLWVMEEYGVGESWTNVKIHGIKSYSVNCVSLIEGSNGDIVLGKTNKGRVIIYNKEERRCRDVGIIGVPRNIYIRGAYVETLESLHRILTL